MMGIKYCPLLTAHLVRLFGQGGLNNPVKMLFFKPPLSFKSGAGPSELGLLPISYQVI